MDPVALAQMLQSGGPWALLALSLLANKYQFDKNQDLQSERLKDTKEAMASIASAVKTVETVIDRLTHPGKR